MFAEYHCGESRRLCADRGKTEVKGTPLHGVGFKAQSQVLYESPSWEIEKLVSRALSFASKNIAVVILF